MKRTIRRVCTVLCCVALVMLIAMLAVACDKNQNKNQNKKPAEELAVITLVEGVGDGVTQSTVSAKAGALLKDVVNGVTKKPVESLTFGGWFVDGEPLSDEATVPEEGCTLTAKYKAAYTVSVYEQNVNGEYVKKDNEQGSAWYGEAFAYSNIPEHFSLGDKPSGNGFADSKTQSASLGINEQFVVYLARDKHIVNVKCGAGEEADYQIEALYGASITLKTESELDLGIIYRLAGWANEENGAVVYDGGDSVIVTENITVYAVWDKVYIDLLGGDDYIFLPVREKNVVYLRREGLGEKRGTVNASGVFSFATDDGNVLDGKIVAEVFFHYFVDILENTYEAFDGSAATMQLKAHGMAEYTPAGGEGIQGTYEINSEDGTFVFSTDNSEQTLTFALTSKNGKAVFHPLDSEEAGYYHLFTTEENIDDCDCIYLDGMGRLKFYLKNDEGGFDKFDGKYECVDMETKTYLITLVTDYGYEITQMYIRLEVKIINENTKFRGMYHESDDYRGEYRVGDWSKPTQYEFDGFGTAYKNGEQGTYTVEEFEHWSAISGNNVYEVTEHYIQVSVGGNSTLLYFVDDLSGQVVVEVEGAFGRYDFENVLFVNGAIYNDGEKTKAFITLTRTSGGAMYAMVWVGMIDGESGEWLYQILVEDTAYKNGNVYTFNGTELTFNFSIDDEEHTALYVSDSLMFVDDENGKLEIDLSGKAWFTAVGGTPTEVEYTVEEGVVYVYTFTLIDGGTRVFIFESDVEGAEAVEIPLSNIYDLDYTSSLRRNDYPNTYTARMIRISENIAVIGILLNNGSYLYCYSGLFHVSTEVENEYGFMMNVSIFPTQGYEEIEEEYGWFLFTIDGNKFYQYDDAIDYECSVGRLTTDGYGSAEFTPADGGRVMRGAYVYEGNLVVMETLTARYIFRVTDISTGSFELVNAVSGVAGFYYTFSSDGGMGTDSVFLDGVDVALLYRGSNIIWGTYVRTDNTEREEYKLTFVVNGDEGVKNTLIYYIAVARVPQNGETLYIYILRDDTQLGEFDVVENGKSVGTLTGDGYLSATYTLIDGTVYEGVMQRGDIADSKYNSPRQFEPSVEGKNVLFAVSDENGNIARQFVFNLADGKAVLRTTSYGAYGLRDGGEFTGAYIYLDGVGVAILYDESGDEIERGEYNKFTEKGDGVYQYLGKNGFVFTIYSTGEGYAYTVYSAKSDGVYIGGDWSVLMLDGFGVAKYIDSYGFAINGEAVTVSDDLVVFTPDEYSYDIMYFRVSGKGFEVITDSWILSGDMLYQYIGVINRTNRTLKIPDGIKSIAEGAFDLTDMAYLEILDLNEVQEIGKYVFANSGLKTVTALSLRVIGEGAFYGCSELTSVVLKEVTNIGDNAFSRYFNYSSIKFDISAAPDFSAVMISDSAFTVIGGEDNIGVIFTVNNLEEFNAVYSSNISAGVKDNVFIASNGRDTLSGAIFFGFKTGNVYSFSDGRVMMDVNNNGKFYVAETAEYARYYMNEDGEAVLYLYSASEGKWISGASVSRNDEMVGFGDDILIKHDTSVTLSDADSQIEIWFKLAVYRSENEEEPNELTISVLLRYAFHGEEQVYPDYNFATNEVVVMIDGNEVRISVESMEQLTIG
ncbi:MAG: leucine-rich repeat domain-containing protein [Clostridia bacterium]|nr:leucine-rich repeat domain-containing protein [Clostridia bacterium]